MSNSTKMHGVEEKTDSFTDLKMELEQNEDCLKEKGRMYSEELMRLFSESLTGYRLSQVLNVYKDAMLCMYMSVVQSIVLEGMHECSHLH